MGRHLGPVDTVLMLGNNFGLLADARRAARLLGRFAKLTGGGRILVESLNPYETDNPAHFAYHERNRRRGRMPGQLRIRVRYRSWKTPWFDYLFVSPSEMAALVSAAGWEVASVYEGGGPQFAAVLRQRRRSPWESRPAEPAGQAGSPSDDGIDARGLAPGTLAANVVAGRPGPASVVGQLRSSQTQELRCDDGVHGST